MRRRRQRLAVTRKNRGEKMNENEMNDSGIAMTRCVENNVQYP